MTAAPPAVCSANPMHCAVLCGLPMQQIRQLESQLAQLRSQAAEVEDKRVKLQQRQSVALDALSTSTGRKLPVGFVFGVRPKHRPICCACCVLQAYPCLGVSMVVFSFLSQCSSAVLSWRLAPTSAGLTVLASTNLSAGSMCCNHVLCLPWLQGLSAQHYNQELAAADKLLAVSGHGSKKEKEVVRVETPAGVCVCVCPW